MRNLGFDSFEPASMLNAQLDGIATIISSVNACILVDLHVAIDEYSRVVRSRKAFFGDKLSVDA